KLVVSALTCLANNGHEYHPHAWLNPNALIQRIIFASALTAGRQALEQTPAGSIEQIREAKRTTADNQLARNGPVDPTARIKLVGGTLSTETKAAIENSRPAFRAPLILGSPEFMQR